jgi:hypothetical protein
MGREYAIRALSDLDWPPGVEQGRPQKRERKMFVASELAENRKGVRELRKAHARLVKFSLSQMNAWQGFQMWASGTWQDRKGETIVIAEPGTAWVMTAGRRWYYVQVGNDKYLDLEPADVREFPARIEFHLTDTTAEKYRTS